MRVTVCAELVTSARGVRSHSAQQVDHLIDLTADAEHFTFKGRVPGKVQLVTIGVDGISKSAEPRGSSDTATLPRSVPP